jgi:hypothetical protein
LARLRGLIGRIEELDRGRVAELRTAQSYLLRIARLLEPQERPTSGAQVREQVDAVLQEIRAGSEQGTIPIGVRPPLTHLADFLQRLGDHLYHCYDVPGLPRTNNDLEHFYRRLKCAERRITGHKRSDSFVVRVGGFAVYAVEAADQPEADLRDQLGGVAAEVWQREREALRAIQERQVKMHRFHLHRDAYLADLEARWTQLSQAP